MLADVAATRGVGVPKRSDVGTDRWPTTSVENRCLPAARSGLTAGEMVALLSRGSNDITALDLLTALFAFVVDESAAAAYAERFLRAFGSLGAGLSKSTSDLVHVMECPTACVALINVLRHLSIVTLREPLERGQSLGSYAALESYLQFTLAHEENEMARLLLLDSQNRLIKDAQIGVGTVNWVSIEPRSILTLALQHNATAVILVHNHPSGDPAPSREDIDFTASMKHILSFLHIALHELDRRRNVWRLQLSPKQPAMTETGDRDEDRRERSRPSLAATETSNTSDLLAIWRLMLVSEDAKSSRLLKNPFDAEIFLGPARKLASSRAGSANFHGPQGR